MTYRSDHEAALHRLETLERELAELHAARVAEPITLPAPPRRSPTAFVLALVGAIATLGAGAWTMFFRVTLPKIRWGLLYGVLLCGARAMGEFGAVSVVSGHIRGLTNTLPLHIEILYNEFDTTAAFAAASLLSGMALVTLVAKFWLESTHGDAIAASHGKH